MKVKMNLNLAGIQNWMLEHGEKVGFAVVAVVFLLFTYSAIQREVLESTKQPKNLEDLASSVQQHITSSTWDQKREEVQVVNYAERATTRKVEVTDFALLTPFNPPVTDPKSKRGVPEVQGVEALRVASGFDIFELKAGPQAGEKESKIKFHAQPWVVVTGLVPIMRQRQEYDRVFGNALGADTKRDTPRYFPPMLERTEVDPSDPAKENWKRVPFAAKYEDQWTRPAEEIVAAEFVDPKLTGSLGPLANNRNWDERVSHPKIRPAGEEFESEAAPAAEPKPKGEKAIEERLPFGDRTPAPPLPARDKKPEKEKEKKPVEFRLLRAFDYTVEPGKKYRYRVLIALENPNYEQSPQFLKDPASARSQYIAGQPSKPTGVIGVPDGHRVLAGPVDAGSRYSEPQATLLVTAIDRQEGLEVSTEMEKVYRGEFANVRQRAVKVKDPTNNQTKQITRDFNSNILLLDMYGGTDLPGRRRIPAITAPGEMLLLDSEGNMTVRNEMDDRLPYERSYEREKPAAPKHAADTLKDDGRRPPPKRRPR